MTKDKTGMVTVRPISFHMDKIIDKYVISGGGYKTIIVQSKISMKSVLNARKRVIEKRKRRKMKK